jgi:hypothetical protein
MTLTTLPVRRRPAVRVATANLAQRRSLFLEQLEERSLLAAFTPGNLVLYRIGDGVAALTNNGNAAFLDEYTPAGAIVQTIALPTTASGTNRQLINQGGVGQFEGAISRSVDGRYIIAAGYATDLGGATALNSTASTAVPRTIGRIDTAGTVDTSTAITNFGAQVIRTAASLDGSGFWYAGAGGVRYAAFGATTGVTLVGGNNVRQLNVFDGQLYRTNQNNAVGNPNSLVTVGTGTPTTTGQTISLVPGVPIGDGTATNVFSPHGYFFADLSAAVPGVDTLYISDDTGGSGGIVKLSFDGSTWLNNGVIGQGSNTFRGLTGSVSGSTVTLYATRGAATSFVSVVDTAGYNAAPAATVSGILATAGASRLFPGITFTPDDGIGAIGGLAGTTNYASGAAATNFASAATFVDASNLAGGSLTVSYASGGLAGDSLSVVDGNSITVAAGVVSFGGTQIATYPTSGAGSGLNNTNLVLTFNANGSANPVLSAAVQALLRQVTFATGAAAGNRVLNVAIAQNGGLTATTTQTISVTAGGPNQPPVNTAPTTPILSTEDVVVSFTGPNALVVNDPDAGATPITTIVSVPSTAVGTFTATNGGGTANLTGNGTSSLTFAGPQAQINLALATLQFTPAAHRNTPFNGATTVTIVTNDGTLSDTDTFNITLTDVNDAPVATTDALGVLATENGPAFTIAAATLLANDNAGAPNESTQTFTITGVSAPVGGTVSLAGTTITFTPAANFNGTASFNYTITDNGESGGFPSPLSGTGNVTFTISDTNDPPTATNDSLSSIAEDSGVRMIPFSTLTGNDSPGPGESSQTLTITSVTAIAGGTVAISGTNVLFTPTTNFNGAASFSYIVQDNGLPPLTAPGNASFTITPVNDDPTISDVANQNIGLNSNTGAIAFTIGDLETAAASLAVTATSNNTTLVPNNIANLVLAGTAANRTINVIPAAGQSGSATITVTVSDGTTTASDTFIVNVAANSAPTISDVAAQTIAEDGSLAAVAFTVNDAETTPATLTVTAVSSNQSILPDAAITIASTGGGGRTVAIVPPANAFGTVTITLTVSDGAALTAVDTFTLNITEINDSPAATNDSLSSSTEDSGVRTISFAALTGNDSAGPTNESGQALAITSVTVIAGGTVSISGTDVLFTPALNFNGAASFTYVVQDNGTTNGVSAPLTSTATVSFTITPVNDAPSFTKGSDFSLPSNSPGQSIANWATGISPGPANESGQNVTFNITGNTNSALFAVPPTIASNGTLTFTPQAGSSGSATITVVAQDNGGTTDGGVDTSAPQTFVVTIIANAPPTITPLGNVVQMIGVAAPVVQLSGITAGGTDTQALQVSATSNNSSVVPNPIIGYTSPNSTGTLTLAPATQTGSATITVTVRDAGPDGAFNSSDDGLTTTQFTVTVVPYNAPPDAENSTRSALFNTPLSGNLVATDADSPNLIYAITVPPALGNITAFNAATGAYTYTPLPGATGLDLFSFSVTDGASSDTATVRIVVQGATATITPSGDDLVIIGTPDPDQIIVSAASAGSVRVRTQSLSGTFPVNNLLIISAGDGGDYIVVSGLLLPTQIDAGNGDDYVSSGLQNDTIIGGGGNDQVNASGGNNVLWGDNVNEPTSTAGGNDVLSSLTGNDVIYGGGGNDELYAGDGDDYVSAGAGDDLVSGGLGNDRLYGGAGIDSLYGDEGDDVLAGGSGADTLVGRTGSDVIIGGSGADWLDGQDGNDLLLGRELSLGTSAIANDTSDTALLALLNSWSNAFTPNLVVGYAGGNDNAVDVLIGGTGDDDFYTNTNDSASDYTFGSDRRYS